MTVFERQRDELLEENLELSEELKAKQEELNDFKSRVKVVTERFNKKSSQLTKAKEIIRNLLGNISEPEIFPDGSSEDEELLKLLTKTEQFLSEVEK